MNINENDRIKMLMGYDVKKTLTENLEPLLLENPNVWKNFLGVADNALDDIFRKGTLKTTQGTAIKSVDDLKNIFKKGSTAALDDVSGTLLTQTFLKNPAIKTSDKASLIKALTNSDDVITKYRGMDQSKIAEKFKKAGYPSDVADDIANKISNRSAGSLQGLTTAEKEAYKKAAAAEKAKLGVKGSLGQHTREKLIQKITNGGKKVTLKGTKTPPSFTTKIKDSFQKIVKTASSQKWTWAKWLGWGALAGISALGIWWLIANWGGDEDIVPDDMPKTDDGLTDTDGGDFPLEDGAYTTPGDPYQYKVVECIWQTKSWKNRGKIIKDWISLENNKKATDILDGRHPEARKDCSNTTPQPVVTTGSTVTQTTQDIVNQQFGVTPQPNAQPEVQTTNDDINNY